MKFSNSVLLALLLAVLLLTIEIDAGRRRKGRRGRKRRKEKVPKQPKDCGPIPHVMNGQGLATDGGVHYACQPGYRLEGTNVITCIDGRWTVAPRCVKELCPQPPNAPYANPPQRSGTGTSATYKCLPGYRIANGNGATSATIHCITTTSSWPAVPTCEPVPQQSCGAPPSVPYAVSQVSGTMATYTCQPGYVRKAGTPTVLHCVGYKWIVTTLPACVLSVTATVPSARCTKAPPCGDATITRGAVADSYTVGSRITYTCITGYRITGSNNNANNSVQLTCRSDGTWGSAPTCEKVVCGQPPAGTNTVTVVTTAIRFGDTYTYACITNFETGMSLTTTCQADGRWSIGTTGPVCTARVCRFSALPTLTNGGPVGIATNADTPVGNNVTFSCNSGFRVAPGTAGSTLSTQTVQCQANGTFTSLLLSCVNIFPTSCRDYYTRDNITPGTAISVLIDTDGTGSNTPITVTCSGSTTQICTDVAPSAGNTLNIGTGCTSTTLGTVFGTTASTFAEPVVGCTSTTVSYPLSDAQLTALIAASNNCQQVVTVACTAGDTGSTDGRIIAIRRNGETFGLAYDYESATIDPTASITGRFPAGSCDCGNAGSCVTAGASCTCSANGGVGTDTITVALSGTQPNYVVEYGFIADQQTANTPTVTTAAEFVGTIGNIQCCENTN